MAPTMVISILLINIKMFLYLSIKYKSKPTMSVMLQSLCKCSPETEKKIYDYQCICSFTVAFLSSCCLFVYETTDDVEILKPLPYIIFGYIFCDLFLIKGDAILHHVFTLIGCYNTIHYFEKDHYVHFLPLMYTEISTVFLIIKIWMDEYNGKKNTILSVLNDLIFISLFVKYRVYGFYNLIQSPETYVKINEMTSSTPNFYLTNASFYIGIYGLFIINLYWFLIICKKIYKQVIIGLVPFLNTELVAELLLSFPILFYVGYYKYVMYINNYQILDLIGISILSFTSAKYHYSKYLYLKSKSNELVEPYSYEKYAMHVRSFLALTTLSLIRETSRTFIYLSAGYHVIFIMTTNNANSMIPYLFDTAMIINYHTDRYELKAELFIITVVIGLVLLLKPFYELNQVLLFLFLILQTNCIAKYAFD